MSFLPALSYSSYMWRRNMIGYNKRRRNVIGYYKRRRNVTGNYKWKRNAIGYYKWRRNVIGYYVITSEDLMWIVISEQQISGAQNIKIKISLPLHAKRNKQNEHNRIGIF